MSGDKRLKLKAGSTFHECFFSTFQKNLSRLLPVFSWSPPVTQKDLSDFWGPPRWATDSVVNAHWFLVFRAPSAHPKESSVEYCSLNVYSRHLLVTLCHKDWKWKHLLYCDRFGWTDAHSSHPVRSEGKQDWVGQCLDILGKPWLVALPAKGEEQKLSRSTGLAPTGLISVFSSL